MKLLKKKEITIKEKVLNIKNLRSLVILLENYSKAINQNNGNYQNKEKLYLERGIQHDYFAEHYFVTNKGTKQ